jgi:serine/threonine protein kinase
MQACPFSYCTRYRVPVEFWVTLIVQVNPIANTSHIGIFRFYYQVLQAVQHCHSHNVVHRDIKPENILLDKDFNVKLTDFGFAKVLNNNERLYEVCGTPGYLAPELLR